MFIAVINGLAYGPFLSEVGAAAFATVRAQELSVARDGEIIESNVQPLYPARGD